MKMETPLLNSMKHRSPDTDTFRPTLKPLTSGQWLSLSLGAVSNSDVGGHGFPLFSVPCSFDDLDFTDVQQLAEAFHEVQPWSSSASLALNFSQ